MGYPATVRSMTGFGVGEVPLGAGRVVAEIRGVNHRFLEVRAKLPRDLADLTLFAEQAARERLRRGRFEIGVRTEGPALPGGALDRERARAAFRALAELRDELAPGAELPLSLLAAVPDLFVPAGGPQMEAARLSVRGAIELAIAAMDRMCLTEGEALAADLRGRLGTVRGLVKDVAARSAGTRDAVRRRLSDRVERLLADRDLALAPGRLEAEIALIADRADVAEELTRIGSHLDQLDGIVSGPEGEAVGRRLDFLLQEMVREVNTLGAKSQDASISHHVVSIKVELERIREQVQNVE